MTFSETPSEPHEPGAVGGVEQHPGHRRGAVVLVEDPDLEVGQLDLGDLRVLLGDRRPQSAVERVDRAVALGGAEVALLPTQTLIVASVSTRPSARFSVTTRKLSSREQRLVGPGLAADQQLEGGVGGLVGVARVLALLDLLDRSRGRPSSSSSMPATGRPGR